MSKRIIKYLSFNLTELHIKILILLVFSIFYSSITLPRIMTQNLIGDEGVYILEGDRYFQQLSSQIFYYNSGSPNFLKLIIGVALSSQNLNRNYSAFYDDYYTNVLKSSEFTYLQNKQKSQQIIFLSRIPFLIFGLLLGLMIYTFTDYFYGFKIASIALILYATHNTLLAQAGFANLDIATTFFIFLTIAALIIYLEKIKQTNIPKWGWLVLTGLLLGTSQATKVSAILLYPFVILIFLIHFKFRKLLILLSMLLISFLALWTIYIFQVGPIIQPGQDPAGMESVYGSLPLIKEHKSDITAFLQLPVFPLGAYFNNFAYQLTHQFYGHTMYINGVFFEHGVWYFSLLSLFYKNSVVLLLMLVLSIVAILNSGVKDWRINYLIIWIFLVLTWSILSGLQLGTRYVFPLYPQFFIVIAFGFTKAISLLIKSTSYQKLTILIIMLIYVFSNISTFPNLFIFRSEVTRFVNPLDLLTDSDFDWGQNVYQVHKDKNTFLYSYSPSRVLFNKNNNQQFMDNFDAGISGKYAISHSSLVDFKKNKPQLYSHFRNKQPDHIIGGNIYVYQENFNFSN